LATGGGLTLASAAQGDDHPAKAPATVTRHHLTPNDCIRINGGDYNACNVGNSGSGNLPYRVIGG
jgi:roadblock/LC7 domain-containing protein